MKPQNVQFKNERGQLLSGRLELPADQHPHSFALFAHCFTCTKNLAAVRNISRILTEKGFGVLRFDFTGLGQSQGDFADTNFGGNVEDLIWAASYLEAEHKAPELLIGHSLGGAAAIFAGARLESVKAVATIGAPSDPAHVSHLLQSGIQEIEQSGQAVVRLSGRPFTIKKQFLEDLQQHRLPEVAKNMRKALLVMHSPQDATVEIKNAENIYLAAHHPKSFVSLDGADHLLSRRSDSIYAGSVIASWAQRYMEIPENSNPTTRHQVVAVLDQEDGFTTQLKLGDHYLTADEPVEVGGSNFGPNPYEYVSAGLAACTAMTVHMYTRRKGWPLERIEVHIDYGKEHHADCEVCDTADEKIDTFRRKINLVGDLDEKQIERILQIADKCPVHKTLHSPSRVLTTLNP